MPFGAPGGDAQCPAMVQMFLNIVELGMDPQVRRSSSPGSRPGTSPTRSGLTPICRGACPWRTPYPRATIRELGRRGHDLEVLHNAGAVTGSLKGIVVDQESGVLKGGADPRREACCIGW